MDLREAFIKILDGWPPEGNITGHELAGFIRTEFREMIKNTGLTGPLAISSSPGQGNWAEVPWLALLNNKVADSIQQGIYPVYLFCANGSGVYFSLNQGTEQDRKNLGPQKAEEKAMAVKKSILKNFPDLSNYNQDGIKLFAKSIRGKSYEKSNIVSLYYPADNIPSNETLISDLNKMLLIYGEISEKWNMISDDKETPIESTIESSENLIKDFEKDLGEAGLIFPTHTGLRFISSLLTKPFVILTGLAGSGKTKIAEAFSIWITDNSNQYCVVAVGADWTNRDPLLGYPNALEQGDYVKPASGVLDLILQAIMQPHKPYFLILDEMNMSHVERYFADFLSAMESANRTIMLHPPYTNPDTEIKIKNDVPSKIILPKNLFIIGTVNIDETTYMFSPKVLDRAGVIEFRVSKTEMEKFLASPSIPKIKLLENKGARYGSIFIDIALESKSIDKDLGPILLPFFNKLQESGAEFGYRTASDISHFVQLCNDLSPTSMSQDEIIDSAIMQKLLPKLHGSRNKIERILKELAKLCLVDSSKEPFTENAGAIKYKLSYEKLARMHKRVLSDGFTSYAEA